VRFCVKKENNSACRMAQVVEHLPSKCKALKSTPRTAKKEKKKRKVKIL
jgi:hypothetical protein